MVAAESNLAGPQAGVATLRYRWPYGGGSDIARYRRCADHSAQGKPCERVGTPCPLGHARRPPPGAVALARRDPAAREAPTGTFAGTAAAARWACQLSGPGRRRPDQACREG